MILDPQPVAGDLLVATHAIGDPNFAQSVVLMLGNEDTDPIGVWLNKPSSTPVESVLPDWAELATPPALIYVGGPVNQQGAICVARLQTPNEDPPGWQRLIGDLGLLHLDTPVEIVAGAYSDLRIYAGYCGWTTEQLGDEFLRGDWLLLPRHHEDIFSLDAAGLWRRILRRQGGEVGLLSTYSRRPEDN